MVEKIKWNRMTDLPEFDTSIDKPKHEYRHHNMFEYDMPIDDYLKIQENTKEIKARKEYDRITGHKEDLSYFDDPNYVEKGIPTPVLEFNVVGNQTDWQEGYRRGLYAKSKGQDTIKTWMAYENRPGVNKTIAKKQYDAFSDFE
jgi:hypothetical protein